MVSTIDRLKKSNEIPSDLLVRNIFVPTGQDMNNTVH